MFDKCARQPFQKHIQEALQLTQARPLANAPEISLRTASAAHANTKETAPTAVPKISMVATGDADSSENLSTTAGIAATAHIASGIRGNIGGSLSFEELLGGLAHLVLGTWPGTQILRASMSTTAFVELLPFSNRHRVSWQSCVSTDKKMFE